MDKPHIASAPGLAWRPRKNGWAAVWLARQDWVKEKGFKPSTVQLGAFTAALTEDEADAIALKCIDLQKTARKFVEDKSKGFDGTVQALVNAYQKDPDSPYHRARFQTRRVFDGHLARLGEDHGSLRLADLGARDFKRWYEKVRWPDGEDGRDKAPTAHARITVVRMMIRFGSAFELDPHCARLKEILSDMTFEQGQSNAKEAMTARQCEDIMAAATAAGYPSMALAQALQFELCLRQKDVVGEWVPMKEPGISTVTWHRRKWLRGIRWEEIGGNMILNHPMSKSRTGKVLEFDLKLYPMVMAEIAEIPMEKRTGPLVVSEITGRPWVSDHFRKKWRVVATAAKIPESLKSMHSRAGGTTETLEATGGNLEAARKQAGHSDIKTTQIYSRGDLKSNSQVAVLRANLRGKNEG